MSEKKFPSGQVTDDGKSVPRIDKPFYDGLGLESVEHFTKLSNLRHLIPFTEDERQVILLALAELSIARPGWVNMLNDIAQKLDNKDEQGHAEMFERFRRNHSNGLYETISKS